MGTLTAVGVSVVAAGVLAIVAVACPGGGSTRDDTARRIADDELAIMVLRPADFGAEFAEFKAGDESGFMTAEGNAEDSIDPQDEALDLERFGWEAGYQVLYFNPELDAGRSSVWFIASGVDLFDTAKNAAGYFKDSWDEAEDVVGKTRDGIILDEAEILDADVADEAAFVQFHVSAEDDPRSHYWASALTFRRGRLLAEVGIYGFEQQSLEDTLTDLARMLDERIGSVVTGDTP
jgi:hypothetical protein